MFNLFWYVLNDVIIIINIYLTYKMNTEVMFCSATMNWPGPRKFLDPHNQNYHFTLDVCALQENA